MSRVWRWRARGALVRRAARAGADLAKGEWVGAGERPRARRRRGRRRSHDPPTRLWARVAEGVTGQEAKAAATGAACGREERWFGRTAEADAELAVGEWVGAGEGRAHDGGEVGGGAATRRLALGLGTRKASRCASARTAGTEADGGCEGRSLRRTAKSRRRARRCRVVGVDARQSARRRKGRRQSRDFVDSHLGSGLKRVTVREGEDSYHRSSARARGALVRAYGGSRRRAHG